MGMEALLLSLTMLLAESMQKQQGGCGK